MRIVNRQQQRLTRSHVDGHPVQAVQNGKRPVDRVDRIAQKQRPNRPRGSGKQRLPPVVPRSPKRSFEQLPDYTECELRLELRPTSTQNDVAARLRPRARRLDQRCLPDPRRALDHQHPATAANERLNRRKLAPPLEQTGHAGSLTDSSAPPPLSASEGVSRGSV